MIFQAFSVSFFDSNSALISSDNLLAISVMVLLSPLQSQILLENIATFASIVGEQIPIACSFCFSSNVIVPPICNIKIVVKQ